MRLTGRVRFVAGVVLCLCLTAGAVAVLEPFSFDLFALVSIVVFITFVEVVTPNGYKPRWQSRIRWLVVVGLLLFTVLTVRYLIQLLP